MANIALSILQVLTSLVLSYGAIYTLVQMIKTKKTGTAFTANSIVLIFLISAVFFVWR